jgi:hypothetical protein
VEQPAATSDSAEYTRDEGTDRVGEFWSQFINRDIILHKDEKKKKERERGWSVG